MATPLTTPAIAALCTALLLGALRPGTARACSACGCGDPTLTAMGLEKPYRNRVRLSVEQRFTARLLGDGLSERDLIGRTVVSASWSPLPRLTLGLVVPLAFQIAEGSSAVAPPLATRYWGGLGDAELLVRGLVWRDRVFSPRDLLWVLAGVKLPTGPRINDNTGYPADEDDQPGTGTLNPVVGLAYGHFGGLFSVFLSAAYQQPVWNLRSYQRGPQVGASLLTQVALGPRVAVTAGADVTYDWGLRLPDGRVVPGAGGELLALTPGLLLALRTDLLLRAAMQIPVWQSWDGPRVDYPTGVLALVVDL